MFGPPRRLPAVVARIWGGNNRGGSHTGRTKRGRRRQTLGAILSFLDDPDEPSRRPAGRRRASRGPAVDRQTLLVRRTIAIGGGLLALILVLVLFRGCLEARQERSLKDYVRDLRSLVEQSDGQGEELFNTLSEPSRDVDDVARENTLNGLRSQATELVERARDLDVPDELGTAHRHLVQTLEFRRDGIGAIADILPTALSGRERSEGARRIAGQMQFFLASDVIFDARVRPNLERPLREEEVLGEVQLPDSRFLPDIDWLDPDSVGRRLRGGGGGREDGEAAPGLHGSGLGTVSLGGQALSAGGSATVRLSEDLAFQVQVVNQGESTEEDVVVRVSIGRGEDAVEVEERIDSIAAGATENVMIPLDQQPPTGQSVPIAVEVEPVPGEEKTDNNKQEFSAIFTR